LQKINSLAIIALLNRNTNKGRNMNNNKFTSLAQSIGSLVINGFEVDYDSNEYGDTISIKIGGGEFKQIDYDYRDVTVSQLVEIAENATTGIHRTVNLEDIKTIEDALNLF